MDPLTAATLISGGIGIADKLFGKDPRKAAMKRLEEQSRRGLDPEIFNRIARMQGSRSRQEISGALSRLRAGGIDSRSGLAQEYVNAIQSRSSDDISDLSSLFREESERARTSANQALAGLPEDESTSDLISSLVMNLGTAKYGQNKGAAAQQPISLLDPRKVKMKQNLGDYGRYAPSRFGAYA